MAPDPPIRRHLLLPTQIANQREIKTPNRPIVAARITYIPTKRRMTAIIRVLSAFDRSLDGGLDPGSLDCSRANQIPQRSANPTANITRVVPAAIRSSGHTSRMNSDICITQSHSWRQKVLTPQKTNLSNQIHPTH